MNAITVMNTTRSGSTTRGTMTDQPSRVAPRLALSPLELRLYAVAVLAAVYLVAWRAIAGGGSSNAVTGAAAAAQGASGARTTVWLDELPPAQRPPLALPTGWRLASRGEPAVATTLPRVASAPTPRALRVRTRSS
ncbi:MAG TPA: hypothetical protein VGD80_43165 [Kofleriaceae bacterium]